MKVDVPEDKKKTTFQKSPVDTFKYFYFIEAVQFSSMCDQEILISLIFFYYDSLIVKEDFIKPFLIIKGIMVIKKLWFLYVTGKSMDF